MSDYSRIAYEFYKNNKICTQCRKRKTSGRIIICDICDANNKLRNKKKQPENRKIVKRELSKKRCYRCGSEMTVQNTLCDKCYGEVVIPEYLRR